MRAAVRDRPHHPSGREGCRGLRPRSRKRRLSGPVRAALLTGSVRGPGWVNGGFRPHSSRRGPLLTASFLEDVPCVPHFSPSRRHSDPRPGRGVRPVLRRRLRQARTDVHVNGYHHGDHDDCRHHRPHAVYGTGRSTTGTPRAQAPSPSRRLLRLGPRYGPPGIYGYP